MRRINKNGNTEKGIVWLLSKALWGYTQLNLKWSAKYVTWTPSKSFPFGVISTMHRENRGGWLQLGYFAYIWGERWVMGWWRTAVEVQPWSGCQTHLYPELFPVVIFTEFLFQSKCHSLPLCRPVVPALPTAACPPAGGAFQTDSWDQICSQQWGPCWCSSVVQVPGSAFQELSSLMGEPGLQRADGHQMHLYFSEVLALCTQYSEQYHPDSAPRRCLVPLCSEESLVPTAEPALLCVALVPASEITYRFLS